MPADRLVGSDIIVMTVDSKIQWKNALGKETGLLETDTIPGYVYKCRFGLTAVKLGA